MRFVLFLLLSLCLMVLDAKQHYTRQLRSLLSYSIYPLQTVVDGPIRFSQWLEDAVSAKQHLLNENIELKYQQLLLQGKLQRLVSLQKENHQLKQLLQSATGMQGRVLVARLLAVNHGAYRQLFILNQGAKQGVYLGQAVLDANGVIGQIIEVGPFTSTVLLVTDLKSAIPVKNARTGERSILIGDRQQLALLDLPKTASIHVGDRLLTSGLAQRFPAGYPVGMVTKVHNDAGKAFITADIKPAAKINRAQLMLLVWPNKEELRLHQQLQSRYQQPVGQA